MELKDYIKALSTANIYITDFVKDNVYCAFTVKRTDLLNNTDLIPVNALSYRYVFCTLAPDYESKIYFNIKPTLKKIAIGLPTYIDKWVICIRDGSDNTYCEDHKIMWKKTNQYYDGYASSGMDYWQVATKLLGVNVYYYEDCITKYGKPLQSSSYWTLTKNYYTTMSYLYITSGIINICNIFKTNLEQPYQRFTTSSDIKYYDDSSFKIKQLSNGRKYILEKLKEKRSYDLRSSSLKTFGTIDICGAFDSTFENANVQDFGYTKELFAQDYDDASYTDVKYLMSFLYEYRNTSYGLENYSLYRNYSDYYDVNITVTLPDDTTETIKSFDTKGQYKYIAYGYNGKYTADVSSVTLLELYTKYIKKEYKAITITLEKW